MWVADRRNKSPADWHRTGRWKWPGIGEESSEPVTSQQKLKCYFLTSSFAAGVLWSLRVSCFCSFSICLWLPLAVSCLVVQVPRPPARSWPHPARTTYRAVLEPFQYFILLVNVPQSRLSIVVSPWQLDTSAAIGYLYNKSIMGHYSNCQLATQYPVAAVCFLGNPWIAH